MLVLHRHQVGSLLDGGVEVDVRVELLEDPSIERSDHSICGIVDQDAGHVGILKNVDGLVHIEPYPSNEVLEYVSNQE